MTSYDYWDNEYKKALRSVSRDMTYTNVVTQPYISYKKVYPVRWLIVVASTIAAFLLSVFLIIIVENVMFYQKQLKEQKS